MSQRLSSVMVFPNFNVAAFDGNGQQVPECQQSLITLWAEHAERNGYDVEGQIVKTPGDEWELYKTEYGWNYKVRG